MNKKNIITTIGFIILVAITILGFFATKYMVTKIEQDAISNLLIRSSTVGSLIELDCNLNPKSRLQMDCAMKKILAKEVQDS